MNILYKTDNKSDTKTIRQSKRLGSAEKPRLDEAMPVINFIKQIEVKESEEKNIVQSEIKEVSTIAAHNDHLKDPDEKEKILDDFNDIDEW